MAMLVAGQSGMAKFHPARRCRPLISGSLWWYKPEESAEWGIAGWTKELDRQAELGFDLLWILNADAAISTRENARLFKELLDECAARKIKLILGTGTGPGVWYQHFDLKKDLAACGENISSIGRHFRGHPAFWAWYIPHEIYMFWGQANDYIQQLYPALVERCKQATNLPVTLSPFFILDRDKAFGDFRYAEPDEYADYWAKLIRKSAIDIVMLQDSGEHFSYVTNGERRPFFKAMSKACRKGGAKFWGNVEVAEIDLPSKAEFVKCYGRVHPSAVPAAPWRPVPIGRLREKLELAADYCERIVSWGYQEFCRPEQSDAAKRWYAEYRQYFRMPR